MSTDTAVAADTTKKVAARVAEKVAETHIAPAVVETAEVAITLPSKFVVSSKVLTLGIIGGVAAGAAGFYGFQKLRDLRAQKKAEKVIPDTIAEPTVVKKSGDNK